MKAIDWLLLAACAVLLLSGPAMALQEFAHAQSQAGLAQLTGETAPLEPAFRTTWRVLLLLVVIVAGTAGTLLALRIARQPKVRAMSARLILLLLAGMTLLDLAFLADGRWFVLSPYALRGATIVWAYPIAGVLIGGSVMRLAEVEDAFGEKRTR